MNKPKDLICLVAVAILLVLAAPTGAKAQNPFAAPAAPTESEQTAPRPTVTEPGIFGQLFRKMVSMQRTMVRDIARYMNAIKDGATPAAIWTGLALAFLYGAVHAVGPGHGKMVVASYFVGREARIGRGLLMGAQIAVTHVVSAVVFVSLVDLSFRQFLGGSPAESTAIRLASYGLIIAIGLYMLYRAVWNARTGSFDCGHDHGHGEKHSHGDSHGGRQQGVLAVVAGLVPCTGAILVMLFALANDILGFGILLVVAISAGMALTMSTIGALAVVFRRIVVNVASGDTSTRQFVIGSILEHLGALLILAVGVSFFAATLSL